MYLKREINHSIFSLLDLHTCVKNQEWANPLSCISKSPYTRSSLTPPDECLILKRGFVRIRIRFILLKHKENYHFQTITVLIPNFSLFTWWNYKMLTDLWKVTYLFISTSFSMQSRVLSNWRILPTVAQSIQIWPRHRDLFLIIFYCGIINIKWNATGFFSMKFDNWLNLCTYYPCSCIKSYTRLSVWLYRKSLIEQNSWKCL